MSGKNISLLSEIDQLVRLQLVDDDTTSLVLSILTYGIIPFISAFGAAGNILSILVLKRQGLQKCSNILLMSLAFADLFCLIGFNNIPKMLHDMVGNSRFLYSKGVSYFLYALFLVFFMMDYGGGMTVTSLPMLITIERLVAVFLPLQFASIVTPKRTWIAVGIAYFYNLSFMFYTIFWFKFDYVYDYELNRTVGVIGRSALFYHDQYAIPTLEEIYFSVKVQPLFTLVGCILIIIKVKVASKKRHKMSSSNTTTKKPSSSKTTQTLLSVCLVYIVVCAVMSLPAYLPESLTSYSLTSDDPSNLGAIMYNVVSAIFCLNSSWNFIVYFALNKNFRDTFREIIGICPCGSR